MFFFSPLAPLKCLRKDDDSKRQKPPFSRDQDKTKNEKKTGWNKRRMILRVQIPGPRGICRFVGKLEGTFPLSLSNIIKPIAPSSTETWRRNITETSLGIGVNSPQEVTKVCVFVLQREIRYSRSAWLLVMDICKETSTTFLTDISDRRSAMFYTLSSSVAYSL